MAKRTTVSCLSSVARLDHALIPNEEAPYSLPDNWCWVRIDAIASIFTGNSINERVKEEKYAGRSDGLVYIATKDISFDSVVDYETNVSIPLNEGFKIAPKDSTLLCIEGGSAGRKVGFITQDVCFVNKLCAFVPINGINPKYLYYVIQSDTFKKQFDAKKHGLIGGVSVKEVSSIHIPLPPTEQQNLIVEYVESFFIKLDEAKEKVQEVFDGFESRKAAILNRAFSGELTTAWRKSHSAIENTTIKAVKEYSLSWTKKEQRLLYDEQQKATTLSMSDNHNWIKCTIGAVARVNNGSTPSRQKVEYWNGNIPWVSSGEVRNNYIYDTLERITKDGFENSSVKLLPIGTVLIAMIGEGKTRGQSAVLRIPATTNQNVAAIIMDHGLIVGEYMWYWLQMNYSKNREKGSGSGQQALNCQRVRELEFVFPGYEEQKEIVRILDNLISKEQQAKEAAEAVIERIDTTKKAILARAFRGELGTNDPTEESAVELLKRII